MGKKPNPLLAKFEAQLEARYQQKLDVNSEFDMMALLLAASDELQVGPGRASRVLNAFLASKMEIAEKLLEDSTGDPEILHTKRDLAWRLREILGAEGWAKYHELFPLLREYWDGT